MITENTKINSFYAIICGLFEYDIAQIDENKLWKHFFHWQNRINGGKYQATFEYFNNSYYDGYLNNIFPEIRHDKSSPTSLNVNYLNHLTQKQFTTTKTIANLSIQDGKTLTATIDFADIYLFPNGIGLFSVKFRFENPDYNLGNVSDFINHIRQLQSSIKINETKYDIKTFISQTILQPLNINDNWTIYNPQLKTYNILDLAEPISEPEMNHLLFDMGNVSPLGSASGNGIFAPSDNYFHEQINHNKLSVFKNWSALILFDTFTRISINFPDTFSSWEYDYFQIYIHSLHIKFYMYLTNSKVSDVTVVTKETEKIRDDFIEFVNDYHQTHISYKFLPDLIQDKLLYALEIQSEISMMETKIKRINEHAQEKREEKMNLVLLTITFLSVFSLIYDLSNWIINMGVDKNTMYPWTSIGIATTVLLLIFITFKKFKT
jgi:hypothetical protein